MSSVPLAVRISETVSLLWVNECPSRVLKECLCFGDDLLSLLP